MPHVRHTVGLIRNSRSVAVAQSQRRGLITLAIETSCDDTCVAILEKESRLDGEHDPEKPARIRSARANLYFNKKITIPNTGLGGIHPLEALDSHRENLAKLIAESLNFLPDAHSKTRSESTLFVGNGVAKQKPDFITVTRGPGMRNNLSCGLDTSKGLAVAWQIPLLGVHHMQAHALTPRLVHWMEESMASGKGIDGPLPAFPFLTLLVSGGHSMLVHSTGLTEHHTLATTGDIAVGDALDKCGRLILPEHVKAKVQDTAFGKHLSHFAFASTEDFEDYPIPQTRAAEIDKVANKFGWKIQLPLVETRKMIFSFAGITSQVESIFHDRLHACNNDLDSAERICFARTVLGTAFEHLGSRTIMALELLRQNNVEIPTLVVSGGVAANDFLRYFLRAMLDARGFANVRLIFPPVSLCTDNAAMIAWCGMEMFEAGYRSDLSMKALRKWRMDKHGNDGGILEAGGWTNTLHP